MTINQTTTTAIAAAFVSPETVLGQAVVTFAAPFAVTAPSAATAPVAVRERAVVAAAPATSSPWLHTAPAALNDGTGVGGYGDKQGIGSTDLRSHMVKRGRPPREILR